MSEMRRLTNNPNGRPELKFTAEQRRMVQILSGMSVPAGVIARNISPDGGIDTRTLKKHFADELENGRDQLVAGLKAQIVKAAQQGSVRAQTWLLERLGGPEFAPKLRVSPDDAAAQIVPVNTDAKVEIYLPVNSRSTSDVSEITTLAPIIDAEPDGEKND
jgi:hypothetical protein